MAAGRAAVLLVALLLAGCAGREEDAPARADADTRRTIAQGTLVGFTDDHGAHAWLGIPYAAPPVGELRWKAPRPPAPWEGEREALRFGAPCPQIGTPLGGAPPRVTGELWGEEDCLFLNVWAPADAGTGERAVLLWIHGGGNSVGHGGFYDGGPLAAREGVVVITLNYRLGPLGWFHHPALAGDGPADASGNYGTLDLLRALAWVREHVAAFGGDPARVTVFGESAGATNLASLLVAPEARGLFRGGIMQSGGTGSVSVAEASHYRDAPEPGLASSSREIVLRLLRRDLGDACDRACARERAEGMPARELAGRLRGLSVRELFDLYGDSGLLGPDSPAVIRDGAVLPEEPFLELLADPARSLAVPMILGSNRDENKIFMAFDPERVQRFLGVPLWRRDPRRYELVAEYGARAWKLRGVDDPARQLRAAGVPVWTYRWDWDEEGSFLGIDLSALLGAAHGLEIPFVFGHWDVGPQSGLLFHDDNAEGRLALAGDMMGYWAEFARSLDPGRGHGEAPLWRDFAPELGRTHVLLDTGPGGILTDDARTTLPILIDDLAGDERVRDDAERCELLATAFRFSEGRSSEADDALAAARERFGCAP